jgi:hypothetical protein
VTTPDPLRALLDTDFRSAVIEAIDALPPREKILMGLYYEEELNLKEIGAVMGVSESRVSQLHTRRWPACAQTQGKSCGLGQPDRPAARAGRHLFVGHTLEGGALRRCCSRRPSRSWWSAPSAPCCCNRKRVPSAAACACCAGCFPPPPKSRRRRCRARSLWSHTARRDGLLSLERT